MLPVVIAASFLSAFKAVHIEGGEAAIIALATIRHRNAFSGVLVGGWDQSSHS
jgi:hypothetical protein